MSLNEFVRNAISENKTYVEEVKELQGILDSLEENRQNPQIYTISITNNV